MIQEGLKPILEKIRQKALEHGIASLSLERIRAYEDIPVDELLTYVNSNEELVEKTLELEREKFMEIFLEYDFEGMNAIDILMIVSKEVSKKFTELSPSITHQLKEWFPEVYHAHFEKRILFISDKIRINLTKGINQGMYRNDLSIELIARLYISRLIDIHNPDFFPPEEFSFKTLYDQMFESFVRSVATPVGLDYFEKQKKSLLF